MTDRRDGVGAIMVSVVTLPLTVATVVAGVAGVGAAAVVSRRGRVALGAVLAGLASAAVVGGLTLAWVASLPGRRGAQAFAAIHLAYLGLTVSLPILGVGLLVLGVRRGGQRIALVLAVLLIVPAPVGAYATHIEPSWLRVDHITVPVDPERTGDDPVRIAVLADYQTSHVGSHERDAVDAVLEAEPDLILVPGDIFQGTGGELDEELPALREDLGRLTAPDGVYFVRGDSDHGDDADRIFAGSEVVILDDEVVEVPVGDRLLRIGGTVLESAFSGQAGGDLVRADLIDTPAAGALTLLVSHRPDTVLALPADSRVDLTVAGHTHGGQIVVPGFGPVLTLSDVPRDVARGGLHEVDGNRIYVSPGVGLVHGRAPQVRLFNRPAVAILTLADAA